MFACNAGRGDQPGGHTQSPALVSLRVTSLCIRLVPLQQLHPLQQNQPPASDPSLCAGSVSSQQLHRSALAPSLCTRSTLLPWIHLPTSDPAPNSLTLPTPPSSGCGIGSADPLGDLPPSPSHGTLFLSHPWADLGSSGLPFSKATENRLQEGGPIREEGPSSVPSPCWGQASRGSPFLPPLPPRSHSRNVPAHPGGAAKAQGKRGQAGRERVIFVSVYFPPSKSTSRREQREGEDGEAHQLSRATLPPPAPCSFPPPWSTFHVAP